MNSNGTYTSYKLDFRVTIHEPQLACDTDPSEYNSTHSQPERMKTETELGILYNIDNEGRNWKQVYQP